MNTTQEKGSSPLDDPFNLARFVNAQEENYDRALAELRSGRKSTHWMWYIFPQINGLGFSHKTKFFAIKSLDEARHYLEHPVLGPRLIECAETVLAIEGRTARQIFDDPDDVKLKSSMTLFGFVGGSVFVRILKKYFQGEQDVRTLHLIEEAE